MPSTRTTRRRRGLLLGVWLVLLLAAGVTWTSSAGAATPTRIVSTPHPIVSIATSSTSLVWREVREDSHTYCDAWIPRRNWSSHAVSTVFRCGSGGYGGGGYNGWHGDLAMGTSAVAFTSVDDEFNCCTDRLDVILSTPPLGARDSSLHLLTCAGDQIVNLVARYGLAAYTRSTWTPTDPGTDCWDGGYMGGGTESMTGGSVQTLNLSGGPPRALTGAPPARFLGLSTQRMALVPYDLSAGTVGAFPPPLPEIQVWNLKSRLHERTIAETGTLTALSMTGDQIAVLVADASGHLRIDRFSASTGAATGSTGVPDGTAPMLASYYQWVVYVVGSTVVGLDTANGVTHTIARPTYRPRQILAVNGKAVWYASAHGWGRILTAPLD